MERSCLDVFWWFVGSEEIIFEATYVNWYKFVIIVEGLNEWVFYVRRSWL